MKQDLRKQPIGIFDSGVGGLTVYRALREALPHEDFIYLGDTARLPYGTKSKETVERYTINAARLLQKQEIKFLVVACNTASAYALDALQNALPDLSYCGVLAAGAEASVKTTRNGKIAVLATEGTVRSGTYINFIKKLRADADVQMQACQMLVALAEEGWCDGVEAETIISRYLNELEPGFDTILLGCTHFPILIPTFRKLCSPDVNIVDSASVTALTVRDLLVARNLKNPQETPGTETFLATDLPERFARVGKHFLGCDIADRVHLTSLITSPFDFEDEDFLLGSVA
ncbi:MAG: glutamate racemase [Alphaproteobacteria bacterium]|nr:glutamate racemase [Alphaproteobacteria bacterium]